MIYRGRVSISIAECDMILLVRDNLEWKPLDTQIRRISLNPSNAEATFIQSTRTQILHLGIHWIALAEYSQMSTHMPGFRSFSGFLSNFVLARLATSSIRVNHFIPRSP